MGWLEKELRKLTEKERDLAKKALNKLQKKELDGLDIKKLKGTDNIFRIREGRIRILYRTENGRIFILTIERRREDTYRF